MRGSWLHRFIIRLTHWEYWPSRIVYLPLMPYYLWLSVKARSFFYFNTANPKIRNGGFTMERKKDIYDLLPEPTYPATCYFKPGAAIADMMAVIHKKGLSFPLIAKPDYGERGLAVKKITDELSLADYARRIPVDFLVQEFIAYPEEIGVFYVKLPGEADGKITGIVRKKVPAVTGDGVRTLQQLILAEDRYVLQWQSLKLLYQNRLGEVIPAGGQLILTPYGNHSRGALFLDETPFLSPALNEVLKECCTYFPDFYYGRLDIRFNSYEELVNEKRYSIIEVNGSGSEPTHIYDPRHSIFFAWKEIIRHWKMLYAICADNKRRYNMPYLTWREGRHEFRAFSRIDKQLAAQNW